MRMATRTLTDLLALFLLSGPAAAQEEELTADKTKTAIGFSVLSSNEGAGMSLWRVRSRSMMGFGLDVILDSASISYENSQEDIHLIIVRPAFTTKQIHSRSKMASFSYQTISMGIRTMNSKQIDSIMNSKRRDHRRWSAKGEIGIGFIWRPSKQASISLRQGLTFGYSHNNPSGPTIIRSGTILARISPTRILVLCYF